MNDLKRVSVVAVFLIVVLRIAIGWQFCIRRALEVQRPQVEQSVVRRRLPKARAGSASRYLPEHDRRPGRLPAGSTTTG